MLTMLGLTMLLSEEAKADAIKEMVVTLLASYGGIALAVSLLVEFLKMLFKDWAKPKAPVLSILMTFFLGAASKVLMPEVYGLHNFKAWTLHVVILVFVAVFAALFHDKFWNVVKGKLGAIIPGGAPIPPVEEEKKP